MSQKFDFVKDIDDSKETWCHAVRIIEFWTVINRKGIEHLEMVIMDANCDEIQILIRHDHTQKWKDFLKEDMTCVINNDFFGVFHEIKNIQEKTSGKKVVVSLKFRDLKLPLSEKNEKPIQSAKSFSNWSGGSQFTIIDRYNVEIWCNRGDTKYRFMFWDVDCTQIIGKAVVTLHTTMVEGGEDNHMVYLDDLDQDPSRRRK
ncbi:hypothetical protein KIW84_043969 [Lathyrus oleraceus]|uniref:Replication protein A 70 kDa DNA-binding subunit B/D first OB fold domain-containing protein n=1 Tax=Pisum sativum TaxID=3888 RepID=A0A9D4XGY4_PEA|nr:hypothetical protein KIW84_043969 [Pisum sativum]